MIASTMQKKIEKYQIYFLMKYAQLLEEFMISTDHSYIYSSQIQNLQHLIRECSSERQLTSFRKDQHH